MGKKSDFIKVIDDAKKNNNYSNLNNYIKKILGSKFLLKRDVDFIIDNIDDLMNFNISSWCFDTKLLMNKRYLYSLFYSFDKWALSRYKEYKDVMSIDSDNKIDGIISSFLKYFNSSQLNDKDILKVLARYEFSSSIMFNLLNELSDESIIYLFSSMLNNKKDVCLYFRFLKKFPVYNVFLDNYMDTVLNNTSDIYEYISAGFFDEKYLGVINKRLNSDRNYMLDSMIYRSLKLWEYDSGDGKNLELQKNNIRELLGLIIDDICRNENINNLSDIKYIGKGSTSTVFKIGSKVIKIGYGRVTNSFPKNPYILEPLLRKVFEFNGVKVFIEVTEFVDTNTKVTSDDIYFLYKKLRDIGLFWLDPRSENVGRLLNDNVIHWKETLKPSEKVLGLSDMIGDDRLKVGDLVILDADAIYKSDTFNIMDIETGIDKNNAIFYEQRYLDDVRSEVVKSSNKMM